MGTEALLERTPLQGEPAHVSAEPATQDTTFTAGLDLSHTSAGMPLGLGGNGGEHPRGSARARAAMLKRAQRSQGNRFVQRMIAHARAPTPVIQRNCNCGTCERCQAAAAMNVPTPEIGVLHPQGMTVQTRMAGSGDARQAMTGGGIVPTTSFGAPIDQPTRGMMSSHFGRNFDDVRVHTDDLAVGAAEALGAEAFTTDRDIYFAAGRYAPGSDQGRHLLAHELTHVMQQEGRMPSGIAQSHDADVMVGAADDALELEAERQADEFSNGAAPSKSPPSSLPHLNGNAPAQRFVQRRAPASPGACKVTVHDPTGHIWPKVGEEVEFAGLYLTENRDQLDNLVWHLIAFGHEKAMIPAGIYAGVQLAQRVRYSANVHAQSAGTCQPGDSYYEDCHRGEVLNRIAEPLEEIAAAAYEECRQMLDCFYFAAYTNALEVLAANEREAKAEAIKYGIKIEETTYEYIDYGMTGGGGEITIAKYSMDPKSPGAAGLAKAAHFLMKQREPFYAKLDEQNQHAFVDLNTGYVSTDQEYDKIGKEVDAAKEHYNNSREVIIAMFPVLAQFSEINKPDRDLRKIAETAPGDDIARLVGGKIHDTLKNIKKSREGLEDGDVNVWRLDPIIGLTKAQFGGETNPVLMRIVEHKVHREEPGILGSLALLVMNIGAILLAPATGGLSLAVAAGVNVAVAASHVQEYLQQSALAGSALNNARALSHDEPSLFWLAFEIVGTAFDVGTAAVSVFKTLGPLVKAAVAAKDAKEAAETLEAVRLAARDANLADAVIEKIGTLRKGEGALIKGFEQESKLLSEVEQLSETEAKLDIGTALETQAGKVHVSDAGHVFSCASPCTELGAKYADIFATDENLGAKLADIQKDAADAAKLKQTGKLKEAEDLAGKVKKATQDLEAEIRKAHPEVAVAEATVEAEKAAAATQIAIEGAAHDVPAVLSAARYQSAVSKLSAKFPVLAKLKEGAIERIVRASLAVAETGGFRQAVRWVSRVKGQLLEELAAVRIRGLLDTAHGRAVLGLEKEAGDLFFIEGSRIRDALGRQLTDGMVVRRVGDRIEIVAVLESKAGEWAAGKLAASLQGLKRMSADELVEGIRAGGKLKKITAIDPALEKNMSSVAVREMDDAARDAFRERLLAAIDKLPDADLKPLKKLIQTGEGQVSLDIERLLEEEDRTVQIILKEGEGGAGKTLTAQVPQRPQFLGAVPKEVATEDLAKVIREEGFDFTNLDLGQLGMTRAELEKVSRALIDELGAEFLAAKNAGIK